MGRVKPPTIDLSYAQARPVMPFSTRHIRIIVVGLGGTGSFLARHVACLVSLLCAAGCRAELTFIDPDTVEVGNLPRQHFCAADIGRFKAEALARRYCEAFGMEIGCIAQTFEPAMVKVDWDSLTVLVGCVDRAAGRMALGEALKENRTFLERKGVPRVWYLDLGNAPDSGQVCLGSTDRVEDLAQAFRLSAISSVSLLPSPLLQQPKLREPRPEELSTQTLSCAELLAANAQAMTINAAMAIEGADYLYRLLVTGDLKKFATFIDLPSGTTRSHYTTPKMLADVIGRKPAFFKQAQATPAHV